MFKSCLSTTDDRTVQRTLFHRDSVDPAGLYCILTCYFNDTCYSKHMYMVEKTTRTQHTQNSTEKVLEIFSKHETYLSYGVKLHEMK